jgi:hypothetical protein
VSYLDEGEFERWMRSVLRTLESAEEISTVETTTEHLLNPTKLPRRL